MTNTAHIEGIEDGDYCSGCGQLVAGDHGLDEVACSECRDIATKLCDNGCLSPTEIIEDGTGRCWECSHTFIEDGEPDTILFVEDIR